MPTLDQPWTKADYDEAYVAYGEPREPGFNNVVSAAHPELGGRELIQLHYHRYNQIPKFRERWKNLTEKLALVPGDRVVVVGSGYSFGPEVAEEIHPGISVIGTEVSDYLEQTKDTSETAEIGACIQQVGLRTDRGRGQQILALLQDGQPRCRAGWIKERLDDNGSRGRVRAALAGGAVDWVVTEDIISCLTDATIQSLLPQWDSMNPTKGIVHLVTPRKRMLGQDTGYNWKFLEEWKQLLVTTGFAAHRVVDQLATIEQITVDVESTFDT